MKNNGFTLIEILISTVIIFITVSLIYLTYFNIEKTSLSLNEKLKITEVRLNFLNSLKENLKNITEEKENFEFSHNSISFEATSNYSPYLFKYTYYTFETDKGLVLVEKRVNLFTDEKIIFPVLKNLYGVNFLFYDGENWLDMWDKEVLPAGIKIEIYETENEKFDYYIKLPEKNEKKK